MELKKVMPKRAAEDVGERISRDTADKLINGFQEKFPTEKQTVFIAKDTILKAIEKLDNVSGIRFMYGFESDQDAESRVILLFPCNNTSTHLAVPNTMMLPEGYMAHNGKKVSFEKTWQILYNHTLRFGSLLPDLAFNQIMRGSFMGINSLLSLLESTDCTGINFTFGYDASVSEPAARNKPVFAAVNSWGIDIDIFDFTQPCPSLCDGPPPNNLGMYVEVKSQLLDLTNNFRDEHLLREKGPLVEMYYYANPSLHEKLTTAAHENKAVDNAHLSQIASFNKMVAELNYDKAEEVFEQTINEMVKTYLFQ